MRLDGELSTHCGLCLKEHVVGYALSELCKRAQGCP